MDIEFIYAYVGIFALLSLCHAIYLVLLLRKYKYLSAVFYLVVVDSISSWVSIVHLFTFPICSSPASSPLSDRHLDSVISSDLL